MPLPERDLIGHIIHLSRSIERLCDEASRATGVTGSQARLLVFLSIVSGEQDIFHPHHPFQKAGGSDEPSADIMLPRHGNCQFAFSKLAGDGIMTFFMSAPTALSFPTISS